MRKKIPGFEKKMHTDELLLAYLDGAAATPLDGNGDLGERSDSALSLASTVTLEAVSTPPSAPIVVKAFCPFNQLFVSIPFPNEVDGWVYGFTAMMLAGKRSIAGTLQTLSF